MAQPIIQYSFTSGEWAPALYARVDLKQYQSGAALIRNFFVDYRGGVTASPGSRYIVWCISGSASVRLIPFKASLTVNYVLVFEDQKLYFLNNGVPVLETAINITAITKANPGVISAVNSYTNGDRVYLASIGGMTELNSQYYTIANRTAGSFTLVDMFGNAVNTTSYTTYTSGGTASRIYVVTSPYLSTELSQLKFAQDVNVMFLTHPNYAPYALTFTSALNWALAAITFGSTVSAPTGQAVATTVGAGTWNHAYVITAVDANGQESAPSSFATLANNANIALTPGVNVITWAAVTGAVSYNVYKAPARQNAAVPAGSMFGYIGNCTSTTFVDDNITADFSRNYPIVTNPFQGSGVQSITLTVQGSGYTSVPTVTLTAAPPGGTTATAQCTLEANTVTVFPTFPGVAGTYYWGPNGVVLYCSVGGLGTAGTYVINNRGSVTSGASPAFSIFTFADGSFAGYANIDYRVGTLSIVSAGTGYGVAPAVTFSASGGSGAAGTTALGAPSAGNPTVPGLFQQRLVLAGPVSNPRQFNMSQPGTYYNFNVTDPVQGDNAFQGTLVSGTLNTIHSLIPQPQGLVILSDQAAWLVNGGGPGTAVDATNVVANAQVFSGAAGPPPITAIDDILYVQSKGSIVRNIQFNWNKQVYTGQDISVQSSHLFYGYTITEWAWAEEPYKLVWAVRNDGILLTLTFLKEQELIAWAHRDTNGLYGSVATVPEAYSSGTISTTVDAVYTVVQRVINGVTVQYIERFQEQFYPSGVSDAWQVDAGIRYDSSVAATSFTGAQHLSGMDCVGVAVLADGTFYTFDATVSATGGFTIATAAVRVTIGLKFTPQLQTLPIDVGNPTIQGKMKFIPEVTVRVNDTLGLQIGSDEDNLVDMNDLVVGNVGKDTNEIVTNLVTGDTVQALDPGWTVPGQYLIQQSLPYPASILGVIPKIEYEKESR